MSMATFAQIKALELRIGELETRLAQLERQNLAPFSAGSIDRSALAMAGSTKNTLGLTRK